MDATGMSGVEDRGAARHAAVKDTAPQMSAVQRLRSASQREAGEWVQPAVHVGSPHEGGLGGGSQRVLEKDGRGGLPSGWDWMNSSRSGAVGTRTPCLRKADAH